MDAMRSRNRVDDIISICIVSTIIVLFLIINALHAI